jgi:hypothetical protein
MLAMRQIARMKPDMVITSTPALFMPLAGSRPERDVDQRLRLMEDGYFPGTHRRSLPSGRRRGRLVTRWGARRPTSAGWGGASSPSRTDFARGTSESPPHNAFVAFAMWKCAPPSADRAVARWSSATPSSTATSRTSPRRTC